jgi:threonine 3-dehydrogenase
VRAALLTGPRALELVDRDAPRPEPHEVLVRVESIGICGTDLHIFDWNEWAQGRVTRVPMTFGHEVAGTVEAVGPEVHHVQPGAGHLVSSCPEHAATPHEVQ